MSPDKPSSLTLLLSSAGRRVELLRHFREDAERLGLDLTVVATDMDADWAPACRVADFAHNVAAADSPQFIEQTLSICAAHKVDFVVPTIDLELEPLVRHDAEFLAQGTDVIVSSLETVRLARDKLETCRLLAKHGVPVPKSATAAEIRTAPDGWTGPLIAKPRGGWSSHGLRRFASVSDLPEDFADGDYVVQELLEGDEYTVNLFFDRDGMLACCIPHLRREVRAGEVSKGVTRRDERLIAASTALGRALDGARGPLCIQAIITPEGRIGIFEINARFGGGFPLAHRAGAPFTKWLLEEIAGLPSSCRDDWKAGVAMLRYDASVIVEESP